MEFQTKNCMEGELIKLQSKINDYANRHNIKDGITLLLESDGSGKTIDYVSKKDIFLFETIIELINILKGN